MAPCRRRMGAEKTYFPSSEARSLKGEDATSMDRQEAMDFLLDLYENPRNYGPLEHADVSLTGGNPGCADLITMHGRFDKDGKLEEIRWEGEGCTISRAAASYVSEMVQG